jgi:hypothetical protein
MKQLKKIYLNQKEECVKGDWFELLKQDFDFICVNMNEEKISSTPINQYKVEIKKLIQKAAFKYFTNIQATHQKIRDIQYEALKIQTYLVDKSFSSKERELLYILRSHCHKSKHNFKKLHRNALSCRFGCREIEDQIHTFMKCKELNSVKENSLNVPYSNIYGDPIEQKQIMSVFIKINRTRSHKLKHLLPGGFRCQDPCKFDCI